MYDPNMPAPLPGQMQITSAGGGFGQPQGQRVGVPGGGGFGGGMPQVPQLGGMAPGGMSPGGFPAFPQGMGGMNPQMGGGFVPPQMPQQFGGGVPQMPSGGQMPGNALGGFQGPPPGGTRGSFTMPDGTVRNGMRYPGQFDWQSYVDAIRSWVDSRPSYSGQGSDFRGELQSWQSQRPDFWTFMNQQQQQAASTPPMAAPTVI